MLSCSQILVVFTVVSFNRIANYCHYTKNISEKIKMGQGMAGLLPSPPVQPPLLFTFPEREMLARFFKASLEEVLLMRPEKMKAKYMKKYL